MCGIILIVTIDALKANPSILKIYRERITLLRNGKGYKACCPFHDDRNPSLLLDEKDGTLVWKCFPCDDGGDVISFVQKFDKVDFSTAAQTVERELEGSFSRRKEKIEEFFKPVLNPEHKVIPLDAFQKSEVAFDASSEAQNWLLTERGITYETAKKLHFGYRQAIPSTPENQDIAGEGWVAIPCIDNGKVRSIEYRSIRRKAFQRQKNMDTILFNLDTVDPLSSVFLTEGKFDAAILEQHGYHAVSLPNATAKISPEMKERLLEAETIILAGDSDDAGISTVERLWADIQERTVLLHWPPGMKDANQTYLEFCKRDPEKFRETVDSLVLTARSAPMPGVYSLQEVMLSSGDESLLEHPDRLRFPWPNVDSMAVLLPGSILFVSATNTGQGKTTFLMNSTLYQAMERGEVVLNYQCEMSPEEIGTLVASHILSRDRNHLTKADYKEAAARMGDCKYYIGRNPTLTRVDQVLDLIENAVRCLSATVVVIDHIHFLCRNEPDEIKAQANAMQRIKNLADKYKLKIIVVGQPRKALQQNKGKGLHITDLKGSETLTSDSSVVWVLHRDYEKIKDPNNPLPDEYRPETMLAQLKGRMKGDGNALVMLLFNGKLSTFNELHTNSDGEYTLFDNGEGVVV